MRFDYTHGNPAKYMVGIYGWNVSDHYYVADMKTAKSLFDKLKETAEKEQSISIWDIKQDVRKKFYKA